MIINRTVFMALAAALVTSDQAYAEYYRYKDVDGKVSITSTMPAEKAKLGYEIIDENGRVIKKVEGEVSGEDLAVRTAKQQAELEEQERIKKQRDYDLSLIRRYSFVSDIEAEKKRKIDELKATLSIVKGNLNALRGELEVEYARAANIERQGRALSDEQKKRISDVEAVLLSTEELYKLREQDVTTAIENYDQAIKRFQELQVLRGKAK